MSTFLTLFFNSSSSVAPEQKQESVSVPVPVPVPVQEQVQEQEQEQDPTVKLDTFVSKLYNEYPSINTWTGSCYSDHNIEYPCGSDESSQCNEEGICRCGEIRDFRWVHPISLHSFTIECFDDEIGSRKSSKLTLDQKYQLVQSNFLNQRIFFTLCKNRVKKSSCEFNDPKLNGLILDYEIENDYYGQELKYELSRKLLCEYDSMEKSISNLLKLENPQFPQKHVVFEGLEEIPICSLGYTNPEHFKRCFDEDVYPEYEGVDCIVEKCENKKSNSYKYKLIDGYHRLASAKKRGDTSVLVVIVSTRPMDPYDEDTDNCDEIAKM